MLMLQLMRVMFPYVMLVCVGSVLMGMLNSRGFFFIPALGTVVLNIGMIASVLFLAPQMGLGLSNQIFGLAWGVVLAGTIQTAFQWPLLHKDGFRFQWVTPWQNETVRRVGAQMLPGIMGVAAYQINLVITQGLAFWLDSATAPVVAPFNYAVRLMELPQGVFGVSLAVYLLPTLSGLAAEKNYPKFRETLKQGAGYLIFINLLATILLIVLAEPIVRLLFERGKFEADATLRASQALVCLAPGLLAFSLVNIFARAFYALHDIRTPMRISVLCLGINIILAAALLFFLRHRGLGIANTLSSCLNLTLLVYALRKAMPKLEFARLRSQLIPLSMAALLAAGSAWGLAYWWESRLGHATLWLKLGHVFVPAILAAGLYMGFALWRRIDAAHEVAGLMLGKSGQEK